MNRVKKCIQIIKNALFVDDWKSMKKIVLMLIGIYIVGLYPLFRANYYYIDDLGRSVYGYRGWDDFGRWISNGLSYILHAGAPLTDISPLPQLFAVVLMSLAGAVLIYVFTKKENRGSIGFWQLLAVLPMGFNPYFMECFSYKYDAPYMAFSVLASVFPFLYIDKNNRIFLITSFLGVMIMCCTYQAASGIYVLLAFYLLLYRWCIGENTKNVLRKFSISMEAFITSMLVYRLFLVKTISTYVSSEVGGGTTLFENIAKNVTTYLNLLRADSVRLWQGLLLALVMIYIINLLRTSSRKKIVTGLVALSIIAITVPISYGAYLILSKPLFAPRGMYGVGFLVAVLAINAITLIDKNYGGKIICLAISWCLLTYSCTYGNALSQQKEYDLLRIGLVLQDLNRIPVNKDPHLLQFSGSVGTAPVTKLAGKKYPVLARTVFTYMGQSDWVWHTHYIFNHVNLPNFKNIYPHELDFRKLNLKTITVTRYHTIKSDGKHVLVELR